MAKLLLLLVVVVAVVWLLRRSRSDGGGSAARGRGPLPPTRPVVECVHCGLHLPLDDAVADGAGRLFCSEAHRLAGPSRADR